MKLATSKPVALLTVQPAGWPAQFDVRLLLKLKLPTMVSAFRISRERSVRLPPAFMRVPAVAAGHVVEDLEVVLVGDERLVAVGAEVADVLEPELRHRRRHRVQVDAREAHRLRRVGAEVDRRHEELDRRPAEAELVQPAAAQRVRVVERQALRLDVAVAGAERRARVAVRQRRRLAGAASSGSCSGRRTGCSSVRLWSTLTSNWLSCRSLIGLIR